MSKKSGAASGSAVRLLVGIVLIAAVVWWVGLDRVADAFARINPLWILPIMAASYVGIAISCLRWQVLLRARGIRVSVHRLVFYYVIGYFFSSFLPGMFGGDIVRGYVFGKKIGNQVESFASVFMERFSGLVGLVALAFFASLANYRTLREVTFPLFFFDLNLSTIMLIIFCGFIVFIVLLFNKPLIEFLGRSLSWKRAAGLRDKFLKFHDAVYYFRSQKKVVAMALFYSFLFQIFTSVNTYIVCLALGLEVSFLDIMVIVPLILLICTIPSTPNATGVWEIAFTVFFSRLGIPEQDALSIGLVLRAKNIVVALVGGFFYIFSGRELKDREAADEN